MPEYFDEHDIVATLRDGRVIAYGAYTQVVPAGASNIVVRVPDLKYVEYVLQVQHDTDPDTELSSGSGQDKKITGNLVGLTLFGVAAGTTLTSKIIAIGPP